LRSLGIYVYVAT